MQTDLSRVQANVGQAKSTTALHAPLSPPYELIRDGFRRGRIIPFLGSGASLCTRTDACEWKSPSASFLPSARELAEYLDRRSGFPSTEVAELTRVAQFYDGIAGRGSLDDELHAVFAKQHETGRLHEYLATCNVPLIVTTNYDNLLEDAFHRAGRRYIAVVYRTSAPTFLVCSSDQSTPIELCANELDLQLGSTTIIFKMHGGADRSDVERGSYVITEDDYVEFLARMSAKTAIPTIFAEPFRKSHFLFLGYGLRDWNLRVILHRIWQEWPNRRYAAWAIQHRADALETEFWNRRQLRIFELGVDAFLDELLS